MIGRKTQRKKVLDKIVVAAKQVRTKEEDLGDEDRDGPHRPVSSIPREFARRRLQAI